MTGAPIGTPRAAPPRPTPWLLILAIWTVYGLLASAQSRIGSTLQHTNPPLPWPTAFLLQMPLAWVWALSTPGILWLGRRFPLQRGDLLVNIPIHIVCCCAIVFLLDLFYAWYSVGVLPTPPTRTVMDRTLQLFVVWIVADGLLYWMILSVDYAAEHQRKLRERELAASELETQLAQADLQALKMQLHPHFLFNALHTIGSLVRSGDRDNAVRVVAGLGELLRRMLDGASSQEVPLRQELEFTRHYLEIEQVRFSDRLKVAINVDDAVLDAQVPHLILQPLVENAIRHGIGPHIAAGHLTVSARKVGDRLHLLVRDDGPGIGDGNGGAARPGIGLSNTMARLTRLYGADYALDVCNAPDGGLEARVELPLRMSPAGAAR